jgi:hypothetical protein
MAVAEEAERLVETVIRTPADLENHIRCIYNTS